MKRRRSLQLMIALVLSAAAAPALAQDSLESIIKSAAISRDQRATMEAEVAQRVKRFADAGENAVARADYRDKIVRTAQVKGASPAGLDAYAEICTGELTPLVTHKQRDIAQDAVLALMAFDHANTARGFAAALSSEHAAIRLMSARGIQNLHAKLANRETDCDEALTALGKAGATERNEHVLRVIYRAINFPADVQGFKQMDACAAALNTVFDGRSQQLSAGSHNEHRDAEGLAAAMACYAGAGSEQKAKLVKHLADFLRFAIDRYFDPDTGEESRPAIADAVDRIEKGIHGMMQASNVTPPSSSLASRLKSKTTDRKALESDVRTSLKEVIATLQKDPWRIP